MSFVNQQVILHKCKRNLKPKHAKTLTSGVAEARGSFQPIYVNM